MLEEWLSKASVETGLGPALVEQDTEDPILVGSNPQIQKVIPNRDILCCHGKLDPNKARDMKRIAKVDDFWLVFAILYCHNTPYPFRRAMTKLSRTHIAFSIQLRRRLMYVGSVSPRFFEV